MGSGAVLPVGVEIDASFGHTAAVNFGFFDAGYHPMSDSVSNSVSRWVPTLPNSLGSTFRSPPP